MADLRIDDASQAAQKARLASPEGRATLDELARIIAGAFVRSLPEGTDLGLDTPEGGKRFVLPGRISWMPSFIAGDPSQSSGSPFERQRRRPRMWSRS